jgi:hypothetical protein
MTADDWIDMAAMIAVSSGRRKNKKDILPAEDALFGRIMRR